MRLCPPAWNPSTQAPSRKRGLSATHLRQKGRINTSASITKRWEWLAPSSYPEPRSKEIAMILQKRLMVCVSAIGLMAGTAMPASAAPWVRGYVVGQYEYAFRYGGRADFTRGAEIEPGVDCKHGASTHFANDVNTKIAVQ